LAESTVEVAVTTITPLEEPECGWCEPCALPSLLVWLVAFEANDRLLDDRLVPLTVCTECGAESWQ
jgi:hypothetical protein